ncbi:MAG: glycosyltransferase family 2 protein [Gammaproteobacteria bacterium]|jgi:(heptosyl)LPS beta-1,4-glucosyltransferase
MAQISAIVLTKNEEDRIAKCLQSLDWVDEIIVFDSGSTDQTCEIAKKFDAKVFVQPNWEGFGRQRELAQEKATGDWILMIDADEEVSPDLRHEIQAKLSDNVLDTAYVIPRSSWVFGRQLKHCWYPDYVLRLYPRNKGKYAAEDLVHEKVYLDDNVKLVKLKHPLWHFTYRDLNHYFVKSNNYARAWAEKAYQEGKRTNLFQAVLHAASSFFKNYFIDMGFLDSKQGFLISILSAHAAFNKYAYLLVKWWNSDKK